MDEDRRGSDDDDDVVAHDVKCHHQIIVDVIDVEVHLARHGIKRTPLPAAPTVDRISSAVYRGVSHDGRFVGGGACNQEPDGDTSTKTQDLDRLDRQYGVIPTVLDIVMLVSFWTSICVSAMVGF